MYFKYNSNFFKKYIYIYKTKINKRNYKINYLNNFFSLLEVANNKKNFRFVPLYCTRLVPCIDRGHNRLNALLSLFYRRDKRKSPEIDETKLVKACIPHFNEIW